jgi:hypothetical protein
MLINREKRPKTSIKKRRSPLLPTPHNKPDHEGSGSLFAWPCGAKPFISNSTLMKIVGSQMSIGRHVPYSAGKNGDPQTDLDAGARFNNKPRPVWPS